MSITPFSVFLIGVYIFLFSRYRTMKKQFCVSVVITLLCSTVVKMGHFISISSSTVPYSTVTLLISCVWAFFLNSSKRTYNQGYYQNYKSFVPVFIAFILSICVTIFLFYIDRYDQPVIEDSNFDDFIRNMAVFSYLTEDSLKMGFFYVIICYCYLIYTFCRQLSYSDFIWISENFVRWSFISIIVGFLEFFTENFFNTLAISNATVSIFGNSGAQQLSLIKREGLYAIQGLTREASMYSYATLYTTFVAANLMILVRKCKKYRIFCLLSLVLLILNRSMSSYVYAIIISSYFVYVNSFNIKFFSVKKNVLMIILLFIFIAFLIIGFSSDNGDNYFFARINESLNEFTNIGRGAFSETSEGSRYVGIYQSLKIFFERPFWGIGFTVSCLSGVISMLCNIGLFGFFFFMCIQFKLLKGLKLSSKIILICLILIFPNLLLNSLGEILVISIPFILIISAFTQSRFTNQCK